ncbi:hypothetical protein TNCV_2990591 [Trichonephila clavipes]|nr:hypothetical protein TNCV_2990591 [Trichonephila clavipes]
MAVFYGKEWYRNLKSGMLALCRPRHQTRAQNYKDRLSEISHVNKSNQYGLPVYVCAFKSNLDQLERVQLSAARVISGLRPSCPTDIVFFESFDLKQEVSFHEELLTRVVKHSDIPDLIRHLALETI